MRRFATVAACAAVALTCAHQAAAQGPTTPDGYCVPGSTQYDPDDLERPGAAPLEWPEGFTRRRVDVEGFSTVVAERGPRHLDEAVVFVHGNPGWSGDFVGIVRGAPAGSRVIAFDLIGFGEASKPYDFPYTAASVVPLIDRLLERLGVERAHVVAQGIGGLVAQEWASAHPERLASATLFAVPGELYQDHMWHRIWRPHVTGEELMHGTTRADWMPFMVWHNPTRPMPEEFLHRNYDFFDRATRCAVLKAYRTEDVATLVRRHADVLRPHDKPALAIYGDLDPYVPPYHVNAPRKIFPRAEVHVFDRSGSWPYVDHEERTVRLMRAFLGPRVATARPRAKPKRCASRRTTGGRRGCA